MIDVDDRSGDECAHYCICGRALPCRSAAAGETKHGFLSYFQSAGPEQGGSVWLNNADDMRRAYIALRIYARFRAQIELPPWAAWGED